MTKKEKTNNGHHRLRAQERHDHILNKLVDQGSASVAEISVALAVSEMTIRRDMIELEDKGKLLRVHGGAILPMNYRHLSFMHREPPTFEERMQNCVEAKARITAAAALVASRYQTVALDAGSTILMLAERLKKCKWMQIFTHSIRIAHCLAATHAAPVVYLAGGRIGGDEMCTVGPFALAQFEQLWFDVAFISLSGVTSNGLYDSSFDNTEMKRIYLRRAKVRIVLCDAEKFQRMSLVQIANLQEIDMIITDSSPPPAIATALEIAHVHVLVAPPLADTTPSTHR